MFRKVVVATPMLGLELLDVDPISLQSQHLRLDSARCFIQDDLQRTSELLLYCPLLSDFGLGADLQLPVEGRLTVHRIGR